MSAGSTSAVQRGRKLSILTTTAQPIVDLYTDARTHGYQGPLRTVRLPRVTVTGGGAIARNDDGTRCAVAGIESLRIVTLSQPSSAPVSEHKSAVGRGGHRVDASRNFWEGSSLTSASTDVAWGSAGYEHKLFTSARNGEFIMWDAHWSSSGKYSIERKTKDHTRSIHKLSVSQFSCYCITGSADGDVRLWDIRDLSKSIMRIRHPTSVRAVAFSPFASHTFQAFTGLDNGNIYRWDLKMGQRGQLDRLPIAHSGPVTSLDWCNPGGSATLSSDSTTNGLGWVVSGGLDHCVKVWDLSSTPHLHHKPTYTLHPSFPVRRVLWRPSYPLEVAIVSNAEFGSGSNPDLASSDSNGGTPVDNRERSSLRNKQLAGDPIEIWDVRRGWVAKWSVNGSATEGGVTDIKFGDSHAIWAQHTSGAFAQLDLRNCTRPIDAIPRVAASWQASGALALVSDSKRCPEIPYDDINPDKQILAEERKTKIKALGDPSYTPTSQVLGVYLDSSTANDLDGFTTLSHGYVFEGHERTVLCDINANMAFQTGREATAQVWMLLGLSLVDLVPGLDQDLSDPRASHAPLLHQSHSAPAALPLHASASPVDRFRKPDSTPGGSLRVSPRRPSTPHDPSTPTLRRSASTSNSRRATPTSSNASSPHLPSTALPPLTPRHASFSSRRSSVGPNFTRHSPLLRRPSISVPSSNVASPGDKGSNRNAGEGALDDSDSSPDEDLHDPIISSEDESTTQAPLISPAVASNRFPIHPSPLSQIAGKHRWTEDEDDADLDSEEDDGTPSPRSTDTESEGPSSSKRRASFSRVRRSSARFKSRSRSSTVASLAAPIISRPLIKQDSQSSIRTVTMGEVAFREQGPPSAQVADNGSAAANNGHRSTSVVHSFAEPLPPSNDEIDPDQLTDRRYDLVVSEEQKYRDIATEALRQAVETFADEGDVQMCAMLSLIAPHELGISPKRATRFIDSYLELLTRLRLYTCSAYIRKYVEAEEIRNSSMLETTIYTFCGKCRKPIIVAAGTQAFGPLFKGGFAYCLTCKSSLTCAICRMPVRSLFFQCSVCCHGGHQACYRRYYSERPMDRLQYQQPFVTDHRSKPKSPGQQGRGGLQTSNLQPSTPTEEDPTKRGHFVHPCAAGCGHYCWIAQGDMESA